MDDNAMHALMMSFGLLVLIIALSISVYMFTQVTGIAERLIYYSDSTKYYDLLKYNNQEYLDTDDFKPSVERYVDIDTIVPTLYRYYKENFCVKIYDATGDGSSSPVLIQVFDRNIENNVNKAVSNSKATALSTDKTNISDYAYKQIFNNPNPNLANEDLNRSYKSLYMYGAPWTGSTENIKKRIDYYISGTAGYIDGVYVDYENKSDPNGFVRNVFAKAINDTLTKKDTSKIKFKERFISYSYSGDTFVTEDGDELTNIDSKDKIEIIYTILGTFD